MKRLLANLMLGIGLILAGCTYYGYPPAPAAGPTSYDRSFFAAADALRDQGVAITVQNQATGTVAGNYGSTPVTATVAQQPDGSVRVQFSATDSRDPALVDRITQSYQRRMGR